MQCTQDGLEMLTFNEALKVQGNVNCLDRMGHCPDGDAIHTAGGHCLNIGQRDPSTGFEHTAALIDLYRIGQLGG